VELLAKAGKISVALIGYLEAIQYSTIQYSSVSGCRVAVATDFVQWPPVFVDPQYGPSRPPSGA
jgi:predicted phosphohydrolase